jgi:cation diffusion facilitator CzcD-associated flavoprotein CzcO
MPRRTPLFPSRLDYHDYLCRYAQRFGIAVEIGTTVHAALPGRRAWQVHTSAGGIEASAIVVATGIVANPCVPVIPGRSDFEAGGGRVMHSVDYRRPAPFAGRRVLVVGVGNSGGEIGSELARAGVDVSVAVRSGAHVVPLSLAGVPIQYFAALMRKLPRMAQERISDGVRLLGEVRQGPPVLPRPGHHVLDAIPLIGFHLVDEIRAGRVRVLPGITALLAGGARFSDDSEHPFDDVILATGFRPALEFLPSSITRDARGFAVRTDRVTSAAHPTLFFVGHNYDSRGALLNIAGDAPLAARTLARTLAGRA